MIKFKPSKSTIIPLTVAGIMLITPIFGQAKLGDQVLKKGIRHDDVKELQQHLVNLNYLNLDETTTYYGEKTIEAVKDFQYSQGLDPDGTFGQSSFEALQILLKLEPLSFERTLKEDMEGKDVQVLQERLKVLGFLDIENCTNYFGPQTREAIMNFQKTFDLKVDGVVGPETIEILNTYRRKPKLSATRGGSRSNSRGKDIVSTARKYYGAPYSFGSSGPKRFDCSGFTSYVYNEHGIKLPHSSSGQASVGSKVNKGDLEIGDLVIFSNTYISGPSHAGIYIGNGDFIHASSAGGGVMISNLNSGYYSNHFTFGRRLF